MSTEIKALDHGRVRLTAGEWPDLMVSVVAVTLTNSEGQYPEGRTIPRADFLAAVAKECQVIVIDRAELPEVTDAGNGTWRFGTSGSSLSTTSDKTATDAREEACELLALAEYLDAHPPVDEAQVEALTESLVAINKDAPDGEWWAQWAARRLIADGWTRP